MVVFFFFICEWFWRRVTIMNRQSRGGGFGGGGGRARPTAIANPQRKVVGLVGDGGVSLNLGELATLAQEKANVT
ncbi:thiamine pyrophosphate-dependent enzyme, partial [Enterobacter hormaechei]